MRRNGTVDSLADLAEVAECVESFENLAGGLQRVGSLKDLASSIAGMSGNGISRASSLKDLASLSHNGSVADLASVSRVGSLMDMQMASRAMEMHVGSSSTLVAASSGDESRQPVVGA